MSAQDDTSPIDELVIAYLDGRISPEDFERLCTALREEPAHLDRFIELATLDHALLGMLTLGEQIESVQHAKLHSEVSGTSFLELLAEIEARPEEAEDEAALSAREIASVGGYLIGQALKSKPALFAYAAAIALLAAALLIPWGGGEETSPAPIVNTPSGPAHTAVATLTASSTARWADDEPAIREALYPGQRFALTHGFAQVTTHDGAVAIIQAPASFGLIDNDNAIVLYEGRLVGLCHTPASQGFVVRTDYADVTDLGTEFGVEVTGDTLTATVFSGEVHITPPGSDPQRLVMNQTARVAVDGDSYELVVTDEPIGDGGAFTRRMPSSGTVIAARLLGVEGFEPRVIAEGFREDVRPFTDRDFLFVVLDEQQGLPQALLGGDLIQMPGDARTRITPAGEGLVLEVEVAEPADVYILLAGRQGTPDWLLRDYEQTPWQVGVYFSPTRTDTYSIWRRTTPASGRRVIAQSVDAAMYSVVVVPRSQTQPNHP